MSSIFKSLARRFSAAPERSRTPSPPKEEKEFKDEAKLEGVVGPPGGPTVVSAAGDLVSAQAIPLKQHVLTGVSNSIPVLFKIETGAIPEKNKQTRIPLNLAIVLDRSGSMSGPKLENSKKAIIKMIENLHPDDIVHFVCYGSRVTTIFQNKHPKSKNELISMVQQCRTEGMTNLSGGLQEGAKLLNSHHKKGFSKRMFLFSDGLANEGVTNVSGLTSIVADFKNKHSIKVDSFGIGDDFDSNMMKNIAEFGSGSFFFIDSAEAIQDLVGKALQGLLELVGEDCTLTVRGSGPGIVKKIYGKDSSAVINGANLGDLHQSNTRTQLVELEVSPKDVGEYGVLTWEVSYTSNNKKTVLSGTVHLTATSNSDEVKKSAEAEEVSVAMAVERAAESDEKIQNFIKQGKAKEALQEQTSQCAVLETWTTRDKSGMMANLFGNAKKTEQLLRTEGCSKKSAQKMMHNEYGKRRGSVKFASHYS